MTSKSSSIAPATLRVLSVASISLAALSRPPTLAATAAAIGLLLFAWSLVADESKVDRHSFRWAGLAVITILMFRITGSVGALTESEASTQAIWLGLLVVAAALAVVSGHRLASRRLSVAVALAAVVITTVAMTVGEWRSDLGLDVYWMHREAGEALAAGENPYTDAVTVSNGSPFAPEGAVIEGYPYPPVVVGTYAATAGGMDPRLVSGVAWLAVLIWLGNRAIRRGRQGGTDYAMFMLLAGLAVWPVVWFASWTEPLSVALFLLTALWWRRRPNASAMVLGLLLASKQYFIFLVPLILFHKDDARWRRLWLSVGVATATVLVGLLPDPDAFVAATILNLTGIGNRPDTQSLSGLLASSGIDFYLSSAAWIAIGLAVVTLLALRSRPGSAADFVARAALGLGIAFFLGQAFPNYWFFILALLAIATTLFDEEATSRVANARASVSYGLAARAGGTNP